MPNWQYTRYRYIGTVHLKLSLEDRIWYVQFRSIWHSLTFSTAAFSLLWWNETTRIGFEGNKYAFGSRRLWSASFGILDIVGLFNTGSDSCFVYPCKVPPSDLDFGKTPHLDVRSTSTETATTQTHSQEPKEVTCSRDIVDWERSMSSNVCWCWSCFIAVGFATPDLYMSRPLDLFCFDFCNPWWPKWQITLQRNLEVLNHVPTVLELDKNGQEGCLFLVTSCHILSQTSQTRLLGA